MPKIRGRKKSILVIMLAILVGVVIYLFFMSEKAIAPTEGNALVLPSAIATATSTSSGKYQDISDNQVEAAVMMYHHIGSLPSGADDIRKGLTVSKEEFDSQVKYLTENGYNILTLGQLDKAIENKKVPEKIAVLTFDDGYDDNFSEALPILKKYKVVGTFFIISSKVDTSEYMSRDQIKELAKAGNEIGSHSATHPSLDKSKGAQLEKEVKKSKEDLEAISETPIISFCYPAGKYNDETIKALSDAGYKIAVTTHGSTGTLATDKLLEIPRYRISANMSFSALFR